MRGILHTLVIACLSLFSVSVMADVLILNVGDIPVGNGFVRVQYKGTDTTSPCFWDPSQMCYDVVYVDLQNNSDSLAQCTSTIVGAKNSSFGIQNFVAQNSVNPRSSFASNAHLNVAVAEPAATVTASCDAINQGGGGGAGGNFGGGNGREISLTTPSLANVSNGQMTVRVTRLSNQRASGTSGTLSIQVWAMTSPNGSRGFPIVNEAIGVLNAGQSFVNIEFTRAFTPLAAGTYYFVLFVSETPNDSTALDIARFTTPFVVGNGGMAPPPVGDPVCSGTVPPGTMGITGPVGTRYGAALADDLKSGIGDLALLFECVRNEKGSRAFPYFRVYGEPADGSGPRRILADTQLLSLAAMSGFSETSIRIVTRNYVDDTIPLTNEPAPAGDYFISFDFYDFDFTSAHPVGLQTGDPIPNPGTPITSRQLLVPIPFGQNGPTGGPSAIEFTDTSTAANGVPLPLSPPGAEAGVSRQTGADIVALHALVANRSPSGVSGNLYYTVLGLRNSGDTDGVVLGQAYGAQVPAGATVGQLLWVLPATPPAEGGTFIIAGAVSEYPNVDTYLDMFETTNTVTYPDTTTAPPVTPPPVPPVTPTSNDGGGGGSFSPVAVFLAWCWLMIGNRYRRLRTAY